MSTEKQQTLNHQLFIAIREGQVNEARRLLAEGADLTTQDADGQTALYLAVERDNLPLVQALITHHKARHGAGGPLPLGGQADYVDTLLAHRPCSFETFDYLLKHGLEPDPELAQVAYQIYVDEGLIRAIQERGRPLAAWLERGADANARDKDGQTALSILIQPNAYGAHDAIATLLKHGADPNRLTANGSYPLHQAAWADGYIPLLLEAGADPALRCPYGPWKGLLALDVARAMRRIWAESELEPVSPRSWWRKLNDSLYEHLPTDHPAYAVHNYHTAYTAPYVHTVDKPYHQEYHGTGIRSPEHPLIGKIGAVPCLACGSSKVLVIYASWSIQLNSGDVSWTSEVYCTVCTKYTQRSFDEG